MHHLRNESSWDGGTPPVNHGNGNVHVNADVTDENFEAPTSKLRISNGNTALVASDTLDMRISLCHRSFKPRALTTRRVCGWAVMQYSISVARSSG